MLLTTEGKKEFLKTKFHQMFNIDLKNEININEDNIVKFVNFVLPLSKLNEYYDINAFKKFLNDNYNNVIFTPTDNLDVIYDYEFYQGVYFIRLKPFSKKICMHIIPKKYDASNTGSNSPLLFFKNSKHNIDETNFTNTSEYERLNTCRNINLYYKESVEKFSNGFYKFNIKQHTQDIKNLQINLGYGYNNTNPTEKKWHITGIIDESDEQGQTIPSSDFTEFNSSLVDVNSDGRLNYTNKILQQKIKNHQIDWDDFFDCVGGFNNPHDVSIYNNDIGCNSAENNFLLQNMYHKTLKYFNDDLYIEENEQHLLIDWIEIREE